ncbi:Inner membrane protein translocase involved in respiratory chain assembly [Handroanthus impetiginosus]|uniref:Inner membrane protein translocase involved in respiratory chain assembly n=1 Tax=Handroanthus impetiginosus TaxID=429701 RepID=A0A2G9HCJ8_9LAMI|nr:Inner membrane protein translocase involved in respiratory chain assembly [Handroanthus impetiginosus]
MRLLLSKLIRRSPPSPPLQLLHFSTHDAPSSSHLLFASSVHHHHLWQHDNNTRYCSTLYLLSPHNCFSFSRRFSNQPDFPDSDKPLLPVRALISMLDSYHDLTGFPWWIIISSSALTMRLALFPLIVLQRKKLKRIGELLPKLPPAFPPPMSGRSFRDQISLFWKEKKAAGCPSLIWFFTSFAIQVPCFLLWIMSIRRMSLGHHPGFDCGGTLWFQNLTECPNGAVGPIFPLVIAGLHFTNVQMSFKPSIQQLPDSVGAVAKGYKIYLQLLTLPILFAAFNLPQGSLVYWLANSSLTLIQQTGLSHPGVAGYLGLAKMNASLVPPANTETGNSDVRDIFVLTKQGKVSAQSLSPGELASFSVKVLTDGRVDTALELLRLALEKDPTYARALFIMGQTLLQKKQFVEATECLEGAISKLIVAGHPTEVEQVDLLILSSLWAGIANVKQGKMEQGLLHLERIAQLEEPGDSKSKAHYNDLLFVLSSVLLNMNRKAEARKYLNKAAAYDPAYSVYLKDLENDMDNFSGDLASRSRDV